MSTRAFFDNFGTILLFAIIGTLWNAMAIGLSLWALGCAGVFVALSPTQVSP
jgi:sodium/hydrogen exchanger-like protein 3